MNTEIRELTTDELDAISGGLAVTLELGFARFNFNANEYGACFNWGLGFGGYDGAVCT
jgi:bacteriocin-like protein